MSKLLFIAPHADDETLGCGGTMLKYQSKGDEIYWLLVTGMSEASAYSKERIAKRATEIETVAKSYKITKRFELNFPPAGLDTIALSEIVAKFSDIIETIKPTAVYVPYRNDAHSDHKIVFDAAMATTKLFRYPYIKQVIAYETISETEYGMKPEDGGFRPNLFEDISEFVEKKLTIMSHYESEMAEFPFPRSREAIEALTKVRGAQSNVGAAEAFMLLKEVR